MEQLLPFVLLIVVFYFILIRPQQKRAKEHRQLVSDVGVGDEVVTIGGMFGKVAKMDDATLWLEVDEGVSVRLSKQAISRRLIAEDEPKPDEAGEPGAPGGSE